MVKRRKPATETLSLFRSLPFHSLYSFIHIQENLRVDHSVVQSKHLIRKERIERSRRLKF